MNGRLIFTVKSSLGKKKWHSCISIGENIHLDIWEKEFSTIVLKCQAKNPYNLPKVR